MDDGTSNQNQKKKILEIFTSNKVNLTKRCVNSFMLSIHWNEALYLMSTSRALCDNVMISYTQIFRNSRTKDHYSTTTRGCYY